MPSTDVLCPTPQPAPEHAWQGQATWRILATDFGQGQGFIQAWSAWRADAQRSAQLHFTAIAAHPVTAAEALTHAPSALLPDAQALSAALSSQLYGLLPGVHRLSFDQGQVLLTLWVGDVQAMLRQQNSTADAVLLHLPFDSDTYSVKALTRHCQRGTVLVTPSALGAITLSPSLPPIDPLRQALEVAGWVFTDTADKPLAHFAPRWEPRKRATDFTPAQQAGSALVVGAGLSGAAMAYSLALRGWKVHVLAAGSAPADGASGLPAGLFCPHVSPDDSILSRLSRSGVRLTLQRLRDVCREHLDWGLSGVLEHAIEGDTGLPTSWRGKSPGAQWSHPANAEQLQAAQLPADTAACWHAPAGWVRPAQLVKAQLAHPNIHFQSHAAVAKLEAASDGSWQACDEAGNVLAQADIAFIASGHASAALLPDSVNWQLQSLRGQVSWGWHTPDNATALPPFSVNGHGNLVTHIAHEQGAIWVMGSTFERDVEQLPLSAAEQASAHAANYEKLSTLLPHSAPVLQPWFTPGDALCQPTWGHVRCASHDRLPIAGPVSADMPGLWAITAMGARGLTLSVLCGELIAAQLHGEPLPLDSKLALHLGTQRLKR